MDAPIWIDWTWVADPALASRDIKVASQIRRINHHRIIHISAPRFPIIGRISRWTKSKRSQPDMEQEPADFAHISVEVDVHTDNTWPHEPAINTIGHHKQEVVDEEEDRSDCSIVESRRPNTPVMSIGTTHSVGSKILSPEYLKSLEHEDVIVQIALSDVPSAPSTPRSSAHFSTGSRSNSPSPDPPSSPSTDCDSCSESSSPSTSSPGHTVLHLPPWRRQRKAELIFVPESSSEHSVDMGHDNDGDLDEEEPDEESLHPASREDHTHTMRFPF